MNYPRWRWFISPCVSLLFVPAAAAAAPAAGAEGTAPLNVVLIVADDLGWTDLACYGSDLHETPHLDGLARNGVRFTAAYAAAPVCTPTRASIMTGKCPARLHMTTWYEASQRPPQNEKLVPPITVGDLPLEEVTIAEALGGAGYFNAHVGKWHLGDAAHYPETQGFDVTIGGTFWGAPPTYFYPYRGQSRPGAEFRYVPRLEWGKEGEYLTDRLTDEALAVLDRVKDRPFFLYLAHHAVHTPIEGKAPLVERYAGKITPGLKHANPTYAAMVQSLDESVGRVVAKLDELRIAQRTAVIFISDNGGYINEFRGAAVTSNRPLRSGKGSLYEGGIRVPLIIRWPGVAPAGVECDEPVISTDLFPTIMEIAGARLPAAGGDGVSLVELIKQPRGRLPRESLFWHYPHYYPTTTPVSAVRAGDWKLLEFHEDRHVELYNVREDIGEARNLSTAMPERATELRDKLHAWRAAVNAQMPAPRAQ
jgi:arylsulfatase A